MSTLSPSVKYAVERRKSALERIGAPREVIEAELRSYAANRFGLMQEQIDELLRDLGVIS